MEGLDGEAMGAEGFDALEAGLGRGDSGHNRDLILEGAGSDLNFLGTGDGSSGGINDENDFAVLDQIHDIGAAFGQFEQGSDGDARIGELAGGTAAGNDLESEIVKPFSNKDGGVLVDVPYAEEDGARFGEGRLGGHLAFRVGQAKGAVDSHDLTGRLHFRAQ